MNDKHLKLLTAVSQGKGEICTAVAEAMQELQLYRALCDGYTLDELRRMSLTFKAQIDVLRGRGNASAVEEFLLVWFDTTEEWVAVLPNGRVLRGKWGAVGYALNAALEHLGRGEAEFDVIDLGGDGPTYRYVKNDEYWQNGEEAE